MRETILYTLSVIVMSYMLFISKKQNYIVLTLISELLNTIRVIPVALGLKVIVDMHREWMKICL